MGSRGVSARAPRQRSRGRGALRTASISKASIALKNDQAVKTAANILGRSQRQVSLRVARHLTTQKNRNLIAQTNALRSRLRALREGAQPGAVQSGVEKRLRRAYRKKKAALRNAWG